MLALVTCGGAFRQTGYILCGVMEGNTAFIVPAKRLLVIITSFTQIDDDVSLPVEYISDLVKRIAATAD